jgi:hypothetical protein
MHADGVMGAVSYAQFYRRPRMLVLKTPGGLQLCGLVTRGVFAFASAALVVGIATQARSSRDLGVKTTRRSARPRVHDVCIYCVKL